MNVSKVFRLENGDRASVSATFTHQTLRQGETVTHETSESLPYGYVGVSIVGEVAPRGVRFGTNASACGQVREDMPSALRRVWARWHLNDMHAGCTHQGGKRELGESCPFSGYRYGHGWLVDPLTLSGALDILRAMDAPSNVTVLAHDGAAVGVFDSMADALAYLHSVTSYSWEHAIRHEGWEVANVIGVPELAVA